MTKNNDTIIAYKGFNSDLTCRGFQYVEGKTYTEGRPAQLCSNGFHAVTTPLDVFGYYGPAQSVYHMVELRDVTEQDHSDSKIAGREITVGAKIELPALIKAQIDFTFKNARKPQKDGISKVANGLATNSGDYGASTNSGYRGASTNSGSGGASTNSGDYGASTNSGSGGVAVNVGYAGKARSSVGGWIAVMEHDENGEPLDFQAFKVDGKKVKADTFYTLKGGKLKEVN